MWTKKMIEDFEKEKELQYEEAVNPKRPLSIYSQTFVRARCENCNSSFPKSGFLGLFGKRKCINPDCKNSK